MKTMADRIMHARSARGLTQEDLANACSVNPRTIGAWERGENEPRGKSLIKVSEILQVNQEWLATGEGYRDSFHAARSFEYVGGRVNFARRYRKISAAQLADALDIEEKDVLLWEEGKSGPTLGQLGDISKLLGFRWSYLAQGDEDPEPDLPGVMGFMVDPAILRKARQAKSEKIPAAIMPDVKKSDAVRETLVAYMNGVADYIEHSASVMERGGKVDLDRIGSEVRAFEDLASKIEIERGVSLLNYIHAELEFNRAWPDAPEDKKNQVLDILKKQIRETGRAPGPEIVEAICYLAR